MPELPEVEVLVRALGPRLANHTILSARVFHSKIAAPTSTAQFARRLRGARIAALSRRGKYLRFELATAGGERSFTLVGHLGMTGRMYLQPASQPLPQHAMAVLRLGREDFIFEDYRRFGRLTLDTGCLAPLGPEPLSGDFSLAHLIQAMATSAQPVKVRLLDQSLIAGVGNIYASEALHRARISPGRAARRLSRANLASLRKAVREVLTRSIARGSTVIVTGTTPRGVTHGPGGYHAVRLHVYDREGLPCYRCHTPIRRIVQAGRSTYFCPTCQRG